MKKNVLLLAGLLVAGLGLTSCGGDTVEPSTEVESKPAETETVPAPESESSEPEEEVLTYSVASGEFTEFGGGVVDLILNDTKKCTFDVTTNAGGDFDAMFDKSGTYSIVDGVINTKIHLPAVDIPAQGDNPAVHVDAKDVEFKATLAEDGTFTLAYVMFGQKTINVAMTGVWPDGLKQSVANGEFTEFGGGVVDLILNDTKTCTFDVTTNAGGDFDAMFDKSGTYSIVDGVITSKIHLPAVDIPAQGDNPAVHVDAKDVEFKATLLEDGTYTIAYVMFGQKTINVAMTGAWPTAA